MKHTGGCHCRAIRVQLETDRHPRDQIVGACQCSFCRKHNARAFSDPEAHLTITADAPAQIHLYEFGLKTSKQVICRQCGVYIAMLLVDGDEMLSVVNIDSLDNRAQFTKDAEARHYDAESKAERIERRKIRWMPTTLVNWPE